MRRLTSGLAGSALAASVVIASVMPLNAAPIYVPKSTEVSANAETVHYVPRRYKKRHGWRYYSRYRNRCYYDRYYYCPRYGYRRHYRPYYPYRSYRYRRGGVTLEFSF